MPRSRSLFSDMVLEGTETSENPYIKQLCCTCKLNKESSVHCLRQICTAVQMKSPRLQLHTDSRLHFAIIQSDEFAAMALHKLLVGSSSVQLANYQTWLWGGHDTRSWGQGTGAGCAMKVGIASPGIKTETSTALVEIWEFKLVLITSMTCLITSFRIISKITFLLLVMLYYY